MQNSFELPQNCNISADELERTRQQWLDGAAKYGWSDARCDKHGEPIRITLSPRICADGSVHLSGKESFCCPEFEWQLALEWDWLIDQQGRPDGLLPD